jgi:hypothetical protein
MDGVKEKRISPAPVAGLRKARIYEIPKFPILVFHLLLAAH